MPYTIIVCDDGSLYGSHKRKIMQREKLFNKLWFLVPQYYNGYDMSKCTVTMRYLRPVSKDFVTETLVLSDEKYEEYLKYVLPVDTCFTKEWGDLELNLTFTMLDVDDNGNIVQRVRKTDNHILTITRLPDWDSIVPDESLSALDQRILKQDAQIKALTDLANTLDGNQVDNLIFDDANDIIQLSSRGKPIGNRVYVRDMLDDGVPVVELSSNSDNNPNPDHNDGCDCGCEDNNVEFDDYLNTDDDIEDGNNVEF